LISKAKQDQTSHLMCMI